MGELSNYAKRNSQFVKLEDGNSIEATYLGFKVGASSFDPDKETVSYKLEAEYGVKILQSGAIGLARLFDKVEEGAQVKITRTGKGNQTKYIVAHKVDGQYQPIGEEVEE